MRKIICAIIIVILFIFIGCNQNDPVSPNDTIVTDIDGNVYDIVQIGDQWWMSENLKVSRYRNGDTIPTGLGRAGWENTTSGAYAIYPHDGGGYTEYDVEGINSDIEMVEAFGKLYNWDAVNDSRGLCPEDWRVPSDEEWTILANYLGGGSMAGGMLKSTSTEPDPNPRWKSPNTGAIDQVGFSGLPSGNRWPNGAFNSLGYAGIWWSSTESSTLSAWVRAVYYNGNDIQRRNLNKIHGFSIRCLRD